MSLVKHVEQIIEDLKKIQDERDEGSLNFIISKYDEVKERLNNCKSLETNPVKGSVRAYLDVYSDYENPVLDKMYKVEKTLNNMAEKNER